MFEKMFGLNAEKNNETGGKTEEYRHRVRREASPAKKLIWKLQAEADRLDEDIARLMLNEKANKGLIMKLIAQKLELKKRIAEKWEEDEKHINPDEIEVVVTEQTDKRRETRPYYQRIIKK